MPSISNASLRFSLFTRFFIRHSPQCPSVMDIVHIKFILIFLIIINSLAKIVILC